MAYWELIGTSRAAGQLMVEYNGFFGSRDSIFAAVGWRF